MKVAQTTSPRAKPARTIADLGEVLKQEIRRAVIVSEPLPPLPPCDVDAEAEIVSALLAGYVRADELTLNAKHFYSDLLRAIFEATADVAPGDLAGVREALIARGWRGAIDHELVVTAYAQPFASIARVHQLCALVVELYEQRQLLAQMQRVDRGLRTGELDRSSARRLLAEAAV